MNNNQTMQKSYPKGKSVVSLVLGIVSMITGIGIIYIPIFNSGPSIFIDYIYKYGLNIFLLFNLLISITGIIFGKISLKSTQKRLSIIGIVLCIIGLLGAVFFYFLITAMSEGM